MAGFRPTQIPKPANDAEFEANCVILFRNILKDPNVHRLGTSGQAQDGVDIVGHRDGNTHQIVGIQCKLKSVGSKLTSSEVRTEVALALGYAPQLAEYFIVTTSKDDTKLTQLAQSLMQTQAAAGRKLQIIVWGWDTLQEKIHQYEEAKRAFDPGFSPSLEAHDRKLDTILSLQEKAATQDQVAALERRISATAPKSSLLLPAEFAQRELDSCLSRILRRRGFAGIDTSAELAALADRAISGDLSLASSGSRGKLCDRAARANAMPGTLEKARELRSAAAMIDPSCDLVIADALLQEASGDVDASLRYLRDHSDPEARSALFGVLLRQRGAVAALDWVGHQRLTPSDFSGLGVLNLIIVEANHRHFDQALAFIEATPDSYFDHFPALRLVRAQLNLAVILPSDQQEAVQNGLPINPRDLQFATDEGSQRRLTAAGEDMRVLIELLRELDLEERRGFFEEFSLWIRLENTSTRATALDQLAREIADPAKTLRRVRLALAYEVPFNTAALERHLAQQKRIGGWSSDERFAAFLIVYRSRDFEKIREFFEHHRDDLFGQDDLPRSMLAVLEIEILARTGRLKEARHRIAHHTGRDLTPEQVEDLKKLVDSVETGNEAEGLRLKYLESKNLTDLRILVSALQARKDLHQLTTFAPILARGTRRREEFDLALRCLFSAEHHEELLRLTDDLPDLVGLDDEYSALKGWTFYKVGEVMKARAIAHDLLARRHVASDRELAINTSIESGDWGHIQAILAREVQRTDSLLPTDLMRLARIALEAGSPYVDQFRDAALEAAPDDPQVNLTAYMLETERGGAHREERAHSWFLKAVEKSGPDGPIQMVSLHELVDQTPRWTERTQEVYAQLRQAEMPLFLAAKGVRRQLMEITLGQALRNSSLDAPRIKPPIFAFSGARSPVDLTSTKAVAFDITALVTLDHVGLLDTALAYFKSSTIAPTTLALLFMERQFLKVRQPSEIARARRIQSLISAGVELLPITAGNASGRTSEMGQELAAMLEAAEAGNGVVVRSAPVAKIGSFLDETVDMTGHLSSLTDTLTVLRFLSDNGKIDTAVRNAAQTYLTQVDKGWTGAQPISPTLTLYLDDLTVTYLDHTDLLAPLTQSVAKVIVSDLLNKQTRNDLQQGLHAEAMLAAVESIRSSVARGVERGRVQFSSRHRQKDKTDHASDSLFDTVPTLDLLSDLQDIDAIVVDDRGLNKLPVWTDGSGRSAVTATTTDILNALWKSGSIDDAAHWQARHRLRLAGYYAVSTDTSELVHHLSNASIADGVIRETPELRAIRESLAMAQIHDCFIPSEVIWLNSIRLAIHSTIRNLWHTASEIGRAAAQSDWLVAIMPVPLEWCLSPEDDSTWAAAIEQAATQIGLLLVFSETDAQRRKSYYNWLNQKFGELLVARHPEVRLAVISFLRSYIERLVEDDNGANA